MMKSLGTKYANYAKKNKQKISNIDTYTYGFISYLK